MNRAPHPARPCASERWIPLPSPRDDFRGVVTHPYEHMQAASERERQTGGHSERERERWAERE